MDINEALRARPRLYVQACGFALRVDSTNGSMKMSYRQDMTGGGMHYSPHKRRGAGGDSPTVSA
jgi:hypothetical protein